MLLCRWESLFQVPTLLVWDLMAPPPLKWDLRFQDSGKCMFLCRWESSHIFTCIHFYRLFAYKAILYRLGDFHAPTFFHVPIFLTILHIRCHHFDMIVGLSWEDFAKIQGHSLFSIRHLHCLVHGSFILFLLKPYKQLFNYL